MGKYMRKAKAAGEVAVMEVAQSSLGVRTRAKTLALQRLQKSPAPATSSGSYLQLRSRRLEKPPIVMPTSEQKRHNKGAKLGCVHNSPKANPNPRTSSRLRVGSVASGSHGSVSIGVLNGEDGEKANEAKEIVGKEEEDEVQENNNTANGDLGNEEASCGENLVDLEGRERWVFWVSFIFGILFMSFFFWTSVLAAEKILEFGVLLDVLEEIVKLI